MVLGPSIGERQPEADPVASDIERPWRSVVDSQVFRLTMTLACFAAGVGAMVLRRVDAISEPKLWAEDGPIFLFGSFVDGAASVFKTYAGYLHLFPRLWALISTLFPVEDIALSYVCFAIIFDVACCSVVLSKRIAWLIPNGMLRATVFFYLVLLPGTSEIYGSLTNTIWYAGVGLILLSLCRHPRSRQGQIAEYSGCLALSLTGVASAIVAPAFFFRWQRERSKFNLLLASTVGLAGVLQSALALTSGRATNEGTLNLGSIPRFVGFRPFATLMLGEEGYLRSASKPLTLALVIALVLFAAVVVYCALLLPVRTSLAVLSVPVASFGLVFLGQGGTFELLKGYAGGRYFLYPMTSVVLLIAGTLSHLMSTARLALAARAGAIMLVPAVGIVSDGALPAHGTIQPWKTSASCISAQLQCHVPLNPPGWFVDLPPLSTARR